MNMETRSKRPLSNPRNASSKKIHYEASTSGDIKQEEGSVELSLMIKWTSGSGSVVKTKVSRLSLKELENVNKLGGLAKGLMDRAFPEDTRPSYITNDQYCRWTPDESCLSYPLDVTKTEFKLIAMYQGWEYVVTCHELGQDLPDSESSPRKLFVTVIEFESVAVVLGNLGIRVSLVAYPVVCVQKAFLEDLKMQLRSNPEFKGILS